MRWVVPLTPKDKQSERSLKSSFYLRALLGKAYEKDDKYTLIQTHLCAQRKQRRDERKAKTWRAKGSEKQVQRRIQVRSRKMVSKQNGNLTKGKTQLTGSEALRQAASSLWAAVGALQNRKVKPGDLRQLFH